MSFRPKDTLRKLADAGADPDSLSSWSARRRWIIWSWVFPRQGIAKVLQIEGVLKSEGKKKINYHKQRNIWGRGPHYSVLRDHYQQNRMEFRMACGLPL